MQPHIFVKPQGSLVSVPYIESNIVASALTCIGEDMRKQRSADPRTAHPFIYAEIVDVERCAFPSVRFVNRRKGTLIIFN